jgi:hypothetical protein
MNQPSEGATLEATWYSAAEAARKKGVAYHSLVRAVTIGELPAWQFGRQIIVNEVDLLAWSPRRWRKRAWETSRLDSRIDDCGTLLATTVGDGVGTTCAARPINEEQERIDDLAEALAHHFAVDNGALYLRRNGLGPLLVGKFGEPVPWAFVETAEPTVLAVPIFRAGRWIGEFVAWEDRLDRTVAVWVDHFGRELLDRAAAALGRVAGELHLDR